ncbi:4-phosphoerythronate dehydrogenase [Parashewanella curva]|uniref:Erythronate-4-phosphate dehydrogenase n=1 Tax=Parashewanella curva TaxID=2338552 RepID=A0A3L8PVD5_9GAMM|nr:4-phosphoerythronate dehydrogenase [Parashewanella curva]RLV59320.1 4-phosphoerythronate dehydrogenase [Parashewanella curva]
MKIIADANMPFAEELFQQFGDVHKLDGRSMTADDVKDADILLVRSVTTVNSSLLAANSKLKFVGTATIGTDHIDQDFLKSKNIEFSNAPGCNAIAVGEYAFTTMLELAHKYGEVLKDKTVGIVGAGNTGSALEKCLKAYGVNTLLCDPIKAEQGEPRKFVSLEAVIEGADVISLHVPLTKEGEHKTFHLLDEAKLKQLKHNAWLLNCCRGEVIDNQALTRVKKYREDIKLVLDVWEGEPYPIEALIPTVDFATPHIAGYSVEGKARGTFMLYEKVCQLLSKPVKTSISQLLPEFFISKVQLDANLTQLDLLRLMRLVYDISDDDRSFRQLDFSNKEFDVMRKAHKHRRECSALTISSVEESQNWLFELGFSREQA